MDGGQYAKFHIQGGDIRTRGALPCGRARRDQRTGRCGPLARRRAGTRGHGGGCHARWHGGGWHGGGWHGGPGWWGPAIIGGLAAGALAAPYAYGYGYGGPYGYGGCQSYAPIYDAYGNYLGQQLVNGC